MFHFKILLVLSVVALITSGRHLKVFSTCFHGSLDTFWCLYTTLYNFAVSSIISHDVFTARGRPYFHLMRYENDNAPSTVSCMYWNHHANTFWDCFLNPCRQITLKGSKKKPYLTVMFIHRQVS